MIIGMDRSRYFKEKRLLQKYEELLSKEEVFWKHKSREAWLSNGDRNEHIFFIIALKKKKY